MSKVLLLKIFEPVVRSGRECELDLSLKPTRGCIPALPLDRSSTILS